MKDIESFFTGIGGEFNSSPQVIGQEIKNIKCLVFDWDGIFNDASKHAGGANTFSESASMGINILRYSFYHTHGINPKTFVVTGAQNPTTIFMSKREHFDGAFFKIKNKAEILPFLLDGHGIDPSECLFVFDDVLDLSLAAKVNLRFLVRNPGYPLLQDYIWRKNYCEYMTGNTGGNNALREVCELIMGLMGNYDEIMDERISFSEEYIRYFRERNEVEPSFFRKEGDKIVPYDPEQE